MQTYKGRQIAVAALLLCWGISQFVAYFHFGVVSSVDSGLYIDNALSLLRLEWPQKEVIFYSAYSATIALFLAAGLNASSVVVLQVLTSALAMLGIFKLTQSLSKNDSAPVIACILYIIWFKFHQWSLIVYTDSLFTSAVVLSVFALSYAKSKLSYVVACVLIGFTAFIRPTGVGFLIALLAYNLLNNGWLKKQSLPVKGAILTVSSVACLLLLNQVLQPFVSSFLQSYSQGELIYPGMTMGVNVPNNITFANATHPPLIQLITFFAENPLYMARLSLTKLILFLGHIKPYYSPGHNIFIAAILYPAYFFALKGVSVLPLSGLTAFAISFFSFQVVTIALTSENWDGRFLLPVLPWVFIYASVGITHTFQMQSERLSVFLRKSPKIKV